MTKHLGDSGNTWGTVDKKNIPKSDTLLDFYGTADQVIASLNIAKLYLKDDLSIQIVNFCIDVIFRLVGQIATGQKKLSDKDYETMISFIDKLSPEPLTKFILNFNTEPSAYLNLARTYVRQLERFYYKVDIIPKDDLINKLLNRMSTLIFELLRKHLK